MWAEGNIFYFIFGGVYFKEVKDTISICFLVERHVANFPADQTRSK